MRAIARIPDYLRNHPLARSRSGAALVEFVLSFPILVFATLIVLDVGRSAFTIMTLNGAAADAARYASVRGTLSLQPATNDEISAFALERAFGVGPGALGVTVDWDPSPLPGAEVEVTITYTVNLLAGQIFNVDPMPVTGSASVTVH